MIPQEEENHNIADLSSENVSVAIADGSEREDPINRETARNALLDGRNVSQVKGATSKDVQLPSGFSQEDLDLINSYEITTEDGEIIKTPRLVIRGAHKCQIPPPTPQKTKVDWISLTAHEPIVVFKELISECFDNISFIITPKGKNGYLCSIEIIQEGQLLGYIAFGAKNNLRQASRPFLSLSGYGCRAIKDYYRFYCLLMTFDRPKLTRLDICHDLFNQPISIEMVVQAHKDHQFKLLKSPKDPKINPIGQIQLDGTNPGRTIEIGVRGSPRFLRFYEKGCQLFGQLPIAIQKNFHPKSFLVEDIYKAPEGANLENWNRCEVEFLSANQVLPLEMLIDTDIYFSGAYPFCQGLLEMDDGKRPIRLPNLSEVDIVKRIQAGKQHIGGLISDLEYMGWTDREIIDALKKGTVSQRFIKSGGIMMTKSEVDERKKKLI